MVAVVNVRVLTAELEESKLVLPVTDFVAERNPISLAEISGLKVGVKMRDVAFDFCFIHTYNIARKPPKVKNFFHFFSLFFLL